MATAVKYILGFALSCTITAATAQKPKPTPAKPAGFQKFTPPKLISLLGINSDTATVFLEEARQLVKIPLKVTDDKKNVYSISSYHLQYRRRAVTEDEESGKVSPIMSAVSDVFRETPLPARWSKILVEQMRAGEELFFYDIVAKDDKGRLMFAPQF
ncbi:MAG: hypothetical protein IPL84_01380 [Chitinophagaceae bacterium]|nr:hypothetical protein [Chitinophagaceae bacterium]